MIPGELIKKGDNFLAVVDTLSCYAQNTSKAKALHTIGEMVRLMAEEDGGPVDDFEVAVTAENESIYITSSDSARLASVLLRHQRGRHQLTHRDVASQLGLKSPTTYRYYETGVEPTLTRMQELLAVVAPELVIAVVPRGSTAQLAQRPLRAKAKRGPKPRKRARRA